MSEKIKPSEENALKPKDKELVQAVKDIDEIAKKFGLDYFDTVFSPVPAHTMYELVAYSIPGRYSHWTFGKDYYRYKSEYDYGMSRFYEIVFNTNPAQAFMMETNSVLENKLIIAHVLGHVDFNKNNEGFKNTNRKMIDIARLNASELNEYRFEYGKDTVEEFLDAALSIMDHTDPRANIDTKEKEKPKKESLSKFSDIFDLDKLKTEKEEPKKREQKLLPEDDFFDLPLFIAQNSPSLEDWQKNIILNLRNEELYFLPQKKTKIMNEGWASFWHKRILRELGEMDKLNPGEDIDWMKMDSGVVIHNPQAPNPYYIGWKIWEDIDQKFKGLPRNDGKKEKDKWGDVIDPKIYKGNEDYDIFRIRKETIADQEFLRNYLSLPLVEELILPYFKLEAPDKEHMEATLEIAKQIFINSYDNFGLPVIKIPKNGGNYNDNRELYLTHVSDGRPLDLGWAEQTLKNVNILWRKKVYLETMPDKDHKILISCDNDQNISSKKLN